MMDGLYTHAHTEAGLVIVRVLCTDIHKCKCCRPKWGWETDRFVFLPKGWLIGLFNPLVCLCSPLSLSLPAMDTHTYTHKLDCVMVPNVRKQCVDEATGQAWLSLLWWLSPTPLTSPVAFFTYCLSLSYSYIIFLLPYVMCLCALWWDKWILNMFHPLHWLPHTCIYMRSEFCLQYLASFRWHALRSWMHKHTQTYCQAKLMCLFIWNLIASEIYNW